MIDWEEALENPELMIKHKGDLKNIRTFEYPWHKIFSRYPYLYREFSDRFDEMNGWDIYGVLREDPLLVLDFKDYLHKINKWGIARLMKKYPGLSLCLEYKDDIDKLETAYYVAFPRKLNDLNKEEKREMSKRIIEFLGKEKI